MKLERANKFYSKLSPHEQAALVFAAAARHDDSEINAILAHVERKEYISVHADYSQRTNALLLLSLIYGTEYWKNRALMLMDCHHADAGACETKTTALQFLANIVAQEHALVDVCNRLNVDIVAVKTMARCPLTDVINIDSLEVNSDLVKQYSEGLLKIMKL